MFHRMRLASTIVLILFMVCSVPLPASAAGDTQKANLGAIHAPQAVSAAHLVTQINFAPRTPNLLTFNQNVTISFAYNTTEAGGVRIFARPFTGNALTPNYGACPSPLYPTGTGTGTCTFTITSGTVTVNKIRFQMWDSSQTTLLFETFVPVYFQFKGGATRVTKIGLNPRSPNILTFNQNVAVSFAYNTTEAGGVRIFARPFSGNALTPNYAACPSPLYPVGSGTGTCTFTITSGAATVTKIRFQVWDAGLTTLLFQSFIPVNYQFKNNLTLVKTIALAPATPNILLFGQNLTVKFKYRTNQAGGVRIFPRPFTGNALTPNYAACGSPLYPVGSGAGTCTFTITDGTVTVNKIRFQVWDAAQTTLLFEGFIPVHYQFR
jgi:hypothetical protein